MSSSINISSYPFLDKQSQDFNFFSHNLNDSIYSNFPQAFNEVFKPEENILEIDEDKEGEAEFICSEEHHLINLDERYFIKDDEKIIKDINFPFTNGDGIRHTFDKLGITISGNNKKIKLNEFKEKKFEIKEMFKDENGKIKKKKKRRKFKPDNIRKKIKAKFHKDLKNAINKKLKEANSKKFFELLPQNFITNITIKFNKQAMKLTYEDLIKNNWLIGLDGRKYKPDKDKYDKNLQLMKYLNENTEISEKAEFDRIKRMTYENLLRVYFSSKEFETSLVQLYYKNKTEKIEYVEEYINKSFTYINFFKNSPRNFVV